MTKNSNNDCFFTNNTERHNEFFSVNLNEMLALKQARVIWGNGYVLSSPKPRIQAAIDKLQKDNDLNALFFMGEKICSSLGFLIPVIEVSKEKNIYIEFAQPYGISQVSWIHRKTAAATVWSRNRYDNTSVYVKTTYTKNKIIRQFYLDDKFTTVMDNTTEIPKELQMEKEVTHNLGIVPVSFFQNLPYKNFFGSNPQGLWYPTDTPVKNYQKFIDQLFIQAMKEVEYNRTRVFADLNPQSINDLLSRLAANSTSTKESQQQIGMAVKSLIGDFIVPVNFKDMNGESSKNFEILKGEVGKNLPFYMEAFESIWKQYLKGVGFSDDIETPNSNRTATEVSIGQNSETTTIKIMRNMRTKQWKEFLDKALMVHGIKESDLDNYTFEIRENLVIEEQNQLETSISKINNGLSTRARELSKMNGITQEEAQVLLVEIDKENEADKVLQEKKAIEQKDIQNKDKEEESDKSDDKE